jgi:hypothetical protein
MNGARCSRREVLGSAAVLVVWGAVADAGFDLAVSDDRAAVIEIKRRNSSSLTIS